MTGLLNTENRLDPQTVLWRHPVADGHQRSRLLVWRLLPVSMVRLARHWLRFWYALRQESRSLRGRIQILLAKKHWGVDLGPLGAYLPDGRLIENERTKARSLGTQELSSRYPWASTIDKEIYLEGFRAGELFARRTEGLDLGTEARATAARPSLISEARQFYATSSSSATAAV